MADDSGRKNKMTPNVGESPVEVDALFVSLMERHEGSVYAVVLGYVRCREEARDLTQETFLRAYRARRSLKDPAKFPSWIMAIARNTALDYVKSRRRERTLREDDAVLDIEAPRFSEGETDNALAAIEGLDEIYRTPFMLKYMEEKSVDEIAQLLDVPASTIEGRLYQARLQLRKKMMG